MPNVPKQTRFWETTWFCILMMFCCCFPLGIFLMWKYKKFNKPVRIAISAFFGMMMLISISSMSSSDDETAEATRSVAVETEMESTEGETAPEITEEETTTETTKEETTAETTVEETTTEAETTAPETEALAVESETEFKQSCQVIPYKTMQRTPEEYIGARIVLTVKISQVIPGGLFDNGQYYRVNTDNSGYDLYLDDEYIMYDMRPEGSMKILQDDILNVYAEFAGITEVTRAFTSTTEEVPAINVYYADLIGE